MNIRRAENKDIERIDLLLEQVNALHHEGRPDLFSLGRKYTDGELKAIIADDTKPIFVAANDKDEVQGYAFCIIQEHTESHILTHIRTLYIDDLCVNKTCRGQHIGTALYKAVTEYAREKGCYNLTLNVWSCNTSAMRFYEKCGFTPQKVGMEIILPK